jgi:hypothetical protein
MGNVHWGRLWFNFEPTSKFSVQEIIEMLNEDKAIVYVKTGEICVTDGGEPIADIHNGCYTVQPQPHEVKAEKAKKKAAKKDKKGKKKGNSK